MISALSHIRNIFSAHKKAVICAVFAGVLFVLPQTLARVELGGNYKGAPFLYQSDDENYLANIQEIIDGHSTASSPIYYGYKNSSAAVLPFGEYLYATPAIIFHVPAVLIVNITKFLFPAALFLLVYALTYSLSKENDEESAKVNAIASGLLVVLGYDFVDFASALAVLKGHAGAGYSSVWARLVNPISGGLFLTAFFIMLWRLINRESRALILGAGILTIIMSGYFFSFAVALSVTFVLMVLMLFRKRGREAVSLFKVILIGILPIVFGLISMLRTQNMPGKDYALTKIGLIYTHVPLFNRFLLVVFAVFLLVSLLFFLKKPGLVKGGSSWWWFCLALLSGVFLVFIQQLVTGVAIWPQHFVQYSIPVAYIVGMVVLYRVIRPWSRTLWMLCVGLVFVSTVSYGLIMSYSYKSQMGSYLNNQRYAPVFNWLNVSSPKDGCVVLVSEYPNYLSGKIPAYTRCDVYYSVQNYYGVPQERIEHGYFSWLRLRGLPSEDIMRYLNEHIMEVRTASFTNWLELMRDSEDPWLKSVRSEDDINRWEAAAALRLASSYKDFSTHDFKTELKKYRLDYVVWDSKQYPEWDADVFPFLEKVYESEGIFVFKADL